MADPNPSGFRHVSGERVPANERGLPSSATQAAQIAASFQGILSSAEAASKVWADTYAAMAGKASQMGISGFGPSTGASTVPQPPRPPRSHSGPVHDPSLGINPRLGPEDYATQMAASGMVNVPGLVDPNPSAGQRQSRQVNGVTIHSLKQDAARAFASRQMVPHVFTLPNPNDPTKPNRYIQRGDSPATLFQGSKAGFAARSGVGKFMGGLQAMTGAYASGSEPLEGLASVAPGLAGALEPVGAGIGIATAGMHMAEGQRAAAAQYQSALGGSTTSAVGSEVAEKKFEMLHLGTMGSGQAKEAYLGTTGLGMRGNERNDATSFISSEYKKLGMSVSSSLQLLQVASQGGTANLNALATTLDNVTKAAKQTNQNANLVRQNFTNLFQSMTQQIGAGPAIQGAAGTLATSQAQLGRNFANVDFSGMSGNTQMQIYASAAGMSVNQAVVKSSTDSTWLPQQQQAEVQRLLTGSGAWDQLTAAVNDVRSKGNYGPGKLQPPQIADIANKVFNGDYQVPAVQSLQIVLSTIGGISGMNYQQVQQFVVAAVAAVWTPGADAKAQQAANAPTAAPSGAAVTKALGGASKVPGIDVGSLTGGTGFMGKDQSHANLRGQYLQTESGMQAPTAGQLGKHKDWPLVDKLLQDNANWSKKFIVTTTSGPRLVDFPTLIMDFADQVEAGSVSNADGSSLSGSSGTAGQGDPTLNSVSGASATRAAPKGVTKTPPPSKQGGTAVAISLTASPTLLNLITVASQITGQGLTSDSASGNLNPPGSVVLPGNAPGASQGTPIG